MEVNLCIKVLGIASRMFIFVQVFLAFISISLKLAVIIHPILPLLKRNLEFQETLSFTFKSRNEKFCFLLSFDSHGQYGENRYTWP